MSAAPILSDVSKALSEIEALMPHALATDVVAFEQLTALYAQTYCLKLRITKETPC
jgi:hypothetical protein